jgi:hypothetical protein
VYCALHLCASALNESSAEPSHRRSADDRSATKARRATGAFPSSAITTST